MKNSKKLQLFILSLFVFLFMLNMVYALKPIVPPAKPIVKPLPPPVLPKPIIIPKPYTMVWENLGDGFLILPGATSVPFVLDKTRIVEEVKVRWTDNGKNAFGLLLFNSQRASEFPRAPVGNFSMKSWFPGRKANTLRFMAMNSPIRLLSVTVVYRTTPEIVLPERSKPTLPSKIQVIDLPRPLRIEPGTFTEYFPADRPFPVARISVNWNSPGKAEGCLLYDNQIPTPDKFRIVVKQKKDDWVPIQRIQRFRFYAKGAPIFITRIIVNYR